MDEPIFKIVHDAKNDFVVLPPMKVPDPNDKDAPKLKRLAPRRPKQQPEDLPNKNKIDE